MSVAAVMGSGWEQVSPKRSRSAGTTAPPLNIASRIPRHRTSPPTAPAPLQLPPGSPAPPKTAKMKKCRKHIHRAGRTWVMGSMGWAPGAHPANCKEKKSHNILTFSSRYSLLGSKALRMNLFLIFAFYLAATGKAFTNAINALREVSSRLSGFLKKTKNLSWISVSGSYE